MGRAIVLGDSVNADQIISGEHVRKDDYTRYLFQKFRDDVNQLIQRGEIAGSILIAGRNFGSGSSRERAAIGIKQVGIKAVVAESFNQIWERNAINCGLRIFRFEPGTKHEISDGDELEIDSFATSIHDRTTGKTYKLMDTPQFVMEIWDTNGLEGVVRQKYMRR